MNKPKMKMAKKTELDKATDNLQEAVVKFIEARRGKVVVVGQVGIFKQLNDDRKYAFTVSVDFVGDVPGLNT